MDTHAYGPSDCFFFFFLSLLPTIGNNGALSVTCARARAPAEIEFTRYGNCQNVMSYLDVRCRERPVAIADVPLTLSSILAATPGPLTISKSWSHTTRPALSVSESERKKKRSDDGREGARALDARFRAFQARGTIGKRRGARRKARGVARLCGGTVTGELGAGSRREGVAARY